MGDALAPIAALTPAVVLLATGGAHAAHMRRFKAQLRAQRLWPRFAEWPVAALVVVSELSLGGAGLLLAFRLPAGAGALRVVLFASSVLFLLFAVLVTVLVKFRPGAPCGCHGAEEPANAWSVARTVTLAVAAFYGGLRAPEIAFLDVWSWQNAVLVAAAASFAVIVWSYPSAMRDIQAELNSTRLSPAGSA